MVTTCEQSRPNQDLAAGRGSSCATSKHLVRAAKRTKKQICGVERVLSLSTKNLTVTVGRTRISAIMQSPKPADCSEPPSPGLFTGYCQSKPSCGIILRQICFWRFRT
jgi:hypothetical protein